MQVQQVHPTVVATQPTNHNQQQDDVRPGFAHQTARAFGICQITLGVLVIVFGATAISLENILSYSGTSIWCGGLFIVTGVLGVVSSFKKSSGIIIASLVMSIISAVSSGIPLLITSSLACAFEKYVDYCYDYYYTTCGNVELRQIIDGMLISLAILESIIAIINSAFCCRAVCCGARQTAQPVVYYIKNPQMATGNVQQGQPSTMMLPPGVQLVGRTQGPQQGYGAQPMYAQPQYGQPQYGQPQYGQPQYSPPQLQPVAEYNLPDPQL